MSAATTTVRYFLAQAALRSDAVMHVVSQRNTGAMNPVCGAHPIRSKEIRTWITVPADLNPLCSDCASLAAGLRGVESLEEGLTLFLGNNGSAPTARLADVPLDAVQVLTPGRSADLGLIHSVRQQGVLQPILLRRTDTGLVLVAGSRRLAAAALAELPSIPAIVHDTPADEAVFDTLAENLHRQDLDPIAQANAYRRALEQLDITQAALADRLGVSTAQLSNTMRLLGLPKHLQENVASGALSAAHGRALLRVTDPAEQDALAAQIVAEGLSTRDTDAVARRAAGVPNGTPAPLVDVSALLAAILGARVKVTASAEKARIVIDTTDSDLERILAVLGAPAVA